MKPKKKSPTAQQVKEVWEKTVSASARSVAKLMIADGFDVSASTIARYKKTGWEEPGVELAVKTVIKKAKTAVKKIETAILAPTEVAIKRFARHQELMNSSLSTNQEKLQQTAVVASILVAEEMVALLGALILNPADTASLLRAITEAAQVKHVGGAGQVPENGDPRVIDGTVNVEDATSKALALFRKNAGLTAA